MIEHRLIERMIALLRTEVAHAAKERSANAVLLESAVDFIRVYADRTHHGKEEDILFRDLASKDLSSEDRRVMDELISEHLYARRTVQGLVEATDLYLQRDAGAITAIAEGLQALVVLYPAHIVKEDKVFFPASMTYLDRQAQAAMIDEMREFDRKMIHEKYRSVVEQFERGLG